MAITLNKTSHSTAAVRDQTIETSIDSAGLHQALHAVSQSQADDVTARMEFRRIIMEYTNAIGVGHVIRDNDGNWDLKPDHASGRVPRRADFLEKFASCCNLTLERNSVQFEHFLGLESIYAPVLVFGAQPEVLLVLTEEKNARRALFTLEIVTAYFGLWLKGRQARRNDWKLTSLAALIELVSEIEKRETVKAACQVAANELARYLGCQQVIVGFRSRGQMRVEALSGSTSIDRASETHHAMEMTLNESVIRDELGVWPSASGENSGLLLAHKQLAQVVQVEGVLSSPLRTPTGDVVGAIVLTGDPTLLHGDKLPNFLRAALPRVASAIEVVSRAQISVLTQTWRSLGRELFKSRIYTWMLVALLVFCLGAMPVRYRVRCRCTTQPTVRRFAVAPFAGVIKRGYVKPGDVVEKGDVLAEMEGQSVRWDLAGIIAERQQALKQREMELAHRDIPASLLSQLKAERLTARMKQLQHRQDQLAIRSPVSGVVLSGSLERAEAAAVEMGSVLYEIGPLERQKVEVTIPAEQVAHVKIGQPARIWMEGLSHKTFIGVIERLQPRSELREARNVFVAEVIVPDGEQLRPGMQGRVRIDCEKHSLAWNIFHRPLEFIISRLAWW